MDSGRNHGIGTDCMLFLILKLGLFTLYIPAECSVFTSHRHHPCSKVKK